MNDRNVVLQPKKWNMCTVLEYTFQVVVFSCDLFKELTGVNNHCNCTDFRPIKSCKKGRKEVDGGLTSTSLNSSQIRPFELILPYLMAQIIFSCTELNIYHFKMYFELCDTYYSE